MKANPKVIVYSIIGLACLALTYLVHWAFILPVLVIIYLNQRELMRKK